jgi:hypothetical protein
MGKNTKPYDHIGSLKAKSTKELEDLLAFWNQRVGKVFVDSIARHQIGVIKSIIAERIGKA